MAEYVLKYADARGEIHQQVAQAGPPRRNCASAIRSRAS